MSELVPDRISTRDLAALLRVSGALVGSLEIEQVLQTAIESAVEVMALHTGAIYLLDGDTLFLGATTPPLPSDFPEHLRVAPLEQHPHIQRALAGCDHLWLGDLSREALTEQEYEVALARNLVSLLYLPLYVEDRKLGIAIVGSTRQTREFGEGDTDLCRVLAHQISMAIANSQLFDSLQRANDDLACAYDATLEGWSLALEMRDEETNGHTARVAELAVELAVRMGVPECDLRHVRRGALLHDIGKMVVPDAILKKPGPLSEDEWAIMRKHPDYARDFLARVDHLLPALDIPYCHHERWDGSGYPRGLKGEEIPIAARVFSVLDTFEALTSDRPYRRAWTCAEALEYIREQSGRQFDPAVVEAFLLEIPAIDP